MSHAHLPDRVVDALPDYSGRDVGAPQFINVEAIRRLLALRQSSEPISWRTFGVGVVLASHMNASGECFPSRATIARECGWDAANEAAQRDVSRILKALRERGYIEIERRKGTSNLYRLPLGKLPTPGQMTQDSPGLFTHPTPGSFTQGERSKRKKEGKEGRKRSESSGCHPADTHAPLIQSAWNKFAHPIGLAQIDRITGNRLRHLRARWADGTVGRMHDLFCEIHRSKFLQGDNDRGWTVSFDWLYGSESNAVKVLEGKYRDREPRSPMEEAPELSQALIDEMEAEAGDVL